IRRGRRARLPALLADHREDRGCAPRRCPPRQALLSARPHRQGGAYRRAPRRPPRHSGWQRRGARGCRRRRSLRLRLTGPLPSQGYKDDMRLLALAAVPLLIAAAPPSGVPQRHLTIERIFASPPISGPIPRLLKLSPDGRYASLLVPRAEDRERFDLWAMDTSTGQLRMLVDSTKIGGGEISEAEKMRRERARVGGSKGIVEYEWAPDGKAILVPVDGDLYLA